MKYLLYKQLISIILSISMFYTSMAPSLAQNYSIASPGDSELISSLVEKSLKNKEILVQVEPSVAKSLGKKRINRVELFPILYTLVVVLGLVLFDFLSGIKKIYQLVILHGIALIPLFVYAYLVGYMHISVSKGMRHKVDDNSIPDIHDRTSPVAIDDSARTIQISN